MAIFTINIQDSGILDTGQLDLNVYYGNVNQLPTTESNIKANQNILIEKEFIKLDFTNDFKNFYIAIPNSISLEQALNYRNFYEDLTDQFKENTSNITITEDSQNVLYTIYNFTIDRNFLSPLELIINLKTI
jgi:hypothetical protein